MFVLPTQDLVTAITWAHNDQKLLIAAKNLLHSLTVHHGIPSLQMLCQSTISSALSSREASFDLVLPTKLKVAVAGAFESIVQVSWLGWLPLGLARDSMEFYTCN